MYKLLLLFAIFAGNLQAAELKHQTTHVAMGDLGSVSQSINSGLSDSSSKDSHAPTKNWSQLSDNEQKVLAPLGGEWDTLRPWQREKMLDIAKDYPNMDAQKQQLVQKRLNSWSRMTPYERENARKRYQQFHNLSDDKKAELRKKWTEYKKLSEAEREKLRRDSIDWESDFEL